MKELSIEEKAKRYDKALERVKELLSRCIDYRDRITKVYRVEDIESIFPELKESEDERVRKEILNVFKDLDEGTTICGRIYDYTKWIAWLERQGEQKPAWSEEDEEFLRRAIKATKEEYPVTANWLKSLKDRYTWKPSEEQIEALEEITNSCYLVGSKYKPYMNLLYQELKKLREE